MKIYDNLEAVITAKQLGVPIFLLNKYGRERLNDLFSFMRSNHFSEICSYEKILEEIIVNYEFTKILVTLLKTESFPIGALDQVLKLKEEQGIQHIHFDVQRLKFLDVYTIDNEVWLQYLIKKEKEDVDCRKNNINLIKNMTYHHNSILDFNDKQLEVFSSDIFRDFELVPRNYIREICFMMSEDAALQYLIEYLSDIKLDITLKYTDYLAISKCGSKRILNILILLYRYSKKDVDMISKLVKFWLMGGAQSIGELKRILHMVKMGKEITVETLTGYLQLTHGNKYRELYKLSEGYLETEKQDLINFAISSNKKAFCNLLTGNMKLFKNIESNSILFDHNFYRNIVNINALNITDIKTISDMQKEDKKMDYLSDSSYLFTFQEFKTLYGQNECYVALYLGMKDVRIDTKLNTIRQIIKLEEFEEPLSGEEIEQLVKHLSMRNLQSWSTHEFSHIEGITFKSILDSLKIYDRISSFLPSVKTIIELKFLISNGSNDTISKFHTIDEIIENILVVNQNWIFTKNTLDLDEAFIRNNYESIYEFCLKDGPYIFMRYYQNNLLQTSEKEKFIRIVKAQLTNQYMLLKYFPGDLEKEVELRIPRKTEEQWRNNREYIEKSTILYECDDFFNTMRLGTMPRHTCLDYRDGMYSNCLLSNFDSNKKILLIKLGNKIVGRAILRLTKGCKKIAGKEASADLTFIDVDHISTNQPQKKKSEDLVLFLERPYFAMVNNVQEHMLMRAMVKMASRKAAELNARLVMSENYSAIVDSQDRKMIRTSYYLFISNSKSSYQYLDSLDGSYSTNKGSYKKNAFVMST